MKIYKRTSEGQWAAFDELSPLPRKLKILLKAVNGKAPEDVYIKSLSAFGDVHALLQSLEQAGLIADRSQRSSSKRSAAMAPPTAPQPLPQRPDTMPVVNAMPVVHVVPAMPLHAEAKAPVLAYERTEVFSQDNAQRNIRPVEWQVLPVLTDDANPPLAMPVLGLPGDPPLGPHSAARHSAPAAAPPTLTAEVTDPVALAAWADLQALSADAPSAGQGGAGGAGDDAFAAGPAWGANASLPAVAHSAQHQPIDPAAGALADLAALSAGQDWAARDALSDLAALAESSARALPSHEASPLASISPENLLAHNALMAAANDEPVADAATTRATVRHAVDLMSNFVLDHVPRAASQVLPEIESIHSLDQWAELMDGYAMFITPAGELGRIHLLQIRRMLAQALNAADVGSKGWYA